MTRQLCLLEERNLKPQKCSWSPNHRERGVLLTKRQNKNQCGRWYREGKKQWYCRRHNQGYWRWCTELEPTDQLLRSTSVEPRPPINLVWNNVIRYLKDKLKSQRRKPLELSSGGKITLFTSSEPAFLDPPVSNSFLSRKWNSSWRKKIVGDNRLIMIWASGRKSPVF